MRFFFDNNLSPRYVEMLKALGVDAVILRKHFKHNTDDVAWVPEVASKGWIIITADAEMNRRRAEKKALREHGAIAFFLRDSFGSQLFWRQAELLCKYWPKITERARTAKSGQMFDVMLNGNIELRP